MQGADKHTVSRDRRLTRISPASLANPSRNVLRSSTGKHQPSNEATGDRQSAYAVFSEPVPMPTRRPERALVHRMIEHRFAVSNVSDAMLLKGVAEGDKAAMHIIFARHRRRVLGAILRMVRNPGIAEDIANQVFLDVWRTANKFEYRARVSTWLLSIARFKALNSLRERVHENIEQVDVLGIADAGDTPDAALDRKETTGILDACLQQLSPDHRQIIDLFYYRENSVAEVSEIVGIPQATVKSRLFYARNQLTKILVNAGLEAASFGMKANKEQGKAISEFPA